MPHALHFASPVAGPLAAALLLAGCVAVTRDFPNLGDPPITTATLSGEAALSPVSVPPPRSRTRMDAETMRDLRQTAATRLDLLAGAIEPQIDALEKAMQAAADSGDAIACRTVHFQFSRLSRLETELSAQLRKLSALPGPERMDEDLIDRATRLQAQVADALAIRRPGLAALETE